MTLNIHGYRYLKDHLSDAHFGKLIIQNEGSSFVYLCHDGLSGKQSVLWDLWAYIVRKLVGRAAPSNRVGPRFLVHGQDCEQGARRLGPFIIPFLLSSPSPMR